LVFSPCAFAVITVIIVGGFVFTGCDNGNVPQDVAVTGVQLTGNTQFSLVVGENRVLSHTVLPTDATNKNVSWSSSDTGVAIVASDGIVYAFGAGTATITVTTRDGSKTATCTVTVTGNIAVTGMELDKATLFLVVGSSGLLTPTFYPANATNKNVSWSSSNQGVATVFNGTVSAFGAGRATITATTEVGEFQATCSVTVVRDIPVVNDMAWIYPGTFIMGSPYDEPESNDNETPHQVTLTEGFYMGKYPVTQKQWIGIMGYNDSRWPESENDYYVDRWEEFPVETISWYEAILYCNLLSMDEGFSPAYTMYKEFAPNAGDWGITDNWIDIPGNWSTDPEDWGALPLNYDSNPTRWNNVRVVAGSGGYRLPTEAQWEYACRAGTTTPFNTGNNITAPSGDEDGYIIFDNNGNFIGGQANYWGMNPYNNGPSGGVFVQTIPVGMFAPNAWGLYDMHGNVTEWVWDRYGSYTRPGMMTDTDPTGPATGSYRIRRGGSYWDDGREVRSAYRSHIENPRYYHDTIGFRVIRPYSVPGAPSSRATGKRLSWSKLL
jgi:formylglycine-generating enzyme required for sulfatase activity